MASNDLPKTAIAEASRAKNLCARCYEAARRCAREVRRLAGRCRRPRGHRAQRRLRESRARGLRRRRTVHCDRPRAHAVGRRRGFGQRHGDPRRGFRRHVRRRPGPCRRGDRAGGAGGLRAAQSRWPCRAARHRCRRRDHVPAFYGGADAHPQGRFPSDRGVRRHGGRGRRRRRAETQSAPDGRCARHRRLDGERHHRISRRGRLDQAAACRLGGAIGNSCGAARPRRLCRSAHGVRRRARLLSRLRQHHQGRLTTPSPAISARAG